MSTPLKRFAHLACPTYYVVKFADCRPTDLVCFDPELHDPRGPLPKDLGWMSDANVATLIQQLVEKLNTGRLDHNEFWWVEAHEHSYVPRWALGIKVDPKPDLDGE